MGRLGTEVRAELLGPPSPNPRPQDWTSSIPPSIGNIIEALSLALPKGTGLVRGSERKCATQAEPGRDIRTMPIDPLCSGSIEIQFIVRVSEFQ